MYIKQKNPMAKRSQEMLGGALLELLLTMPYNQITVTDLCDKAAMARKTFYRNFETKDDIIIFIADTVLYPFAESMDLFKLSLRTIFLNLFKLLSEHKSYLRIFYKNNLFHLVGSRIVAFFEDENMYKHMRLEAMPTTLYKYIPAQITATLISIVETWVEDDFIDSEEDLSKLTEYLLSGKNYAGTYQG